MPTLLDESREDSEEAKEESDLCMKLARDPVLLANGFVRSGWWNGTKLQTNTRYT